MTGDGFSIRRYRPSDLAALEALENRVEPYRLEDAAEVEAMHLRARQAQETGDARWMAPVRGPALSIEDEFDAFWVAQVSDGSVVGVIGSQAFDGHDVIARTHPLAREWLAREDVAELRRLRVAPEARRRGLGERLSRLVIEWAQSGGFGLLVVNTTTAQIPALQLYRKLGFRDVGLSFVGRYELTWLEMRL